MLLFFVHWSKIWSRVGDVLVCVIVFMSSEYSPVYAVIQVGDGTTTVVLLAAEFLKEAKPFVEDGVHSQNLIRSYRTASTLVCIFLLVTTFAALFDYSNHQCITAQAIEKVKELAVSIEGKSVEEKKGMLAKCAATTLSSKLIGGEKEFFATMVVDAVMAIGDDDRLNLIGIKKVNTFSI